MPQNYFVTGLPKAGKTMLLRRLIKALKEQGLRVGGIISPDELHHGTRTGFYVKDIASGRIAALAATSGSGPKVSKYHVDVASFESVAVPAMEGFDGCDVFVIDEIGPMELKSARFSDLLDRILESDTPLIASLHADLAPHYAINGNVILLAENNREAVYNELLADIRTISRKQAVKKKTPKATAGKVAQKKQVEKKAKKAKAAPKPRKKAVSAKKAAAKAAPKEKAAKRRVAPRKGRKSGPKKAEPPKQERGGLFHKLKGLLHG